MKRFLPASRLPRLFVLLLAGSLATSACVALIASLHWPLVGDASLMHYVVFLISQGERPYRDIVDINLPGSYLFEALAMRLFGWGALGWRLYDLALCLILAAASLSIARAQRPTRAAALIAAALFFLIHVQDGLAQLGQRDLLLAALLLLAYATLFAAQRGRSSRLLFALSFFTVGLTLIIKPTFLPLGIVLLILSIRPALRHGLTLQRHLLSGTAALLLPSFAVLLWMAFTGTLSSFWTQTLPLIALHASLGRRPLAYLLAHALSPVAAVAAFWLLVLFLRRPAALTTRLFTVPLERLELLTGIVIALLGYISQGKGYPYQRYPLLALLLLLMNLDLVAACTEASALAEHGTYLISVGSPSDEAAQAPITSKAIDAPQSTPIPAHRFARLIALTALALECLLLAPHAAWQAHTFRTAAPVEQALAQQLASLPSESSSTGASANDRAISSLSGNIQCLDTFGGCINTLYNLRLTESTGFLYDCYLFPPDAPRDKEQAQTIARYRDAFWTAFASAPPRVVVLSEQYCFGAPNGFDRLDRWPELRDEIDQRYVLEREWRPTVPQRWWSRDELPPRFRIYLRRDEDHDLSPAMRP